MVHPLVIDTDRALNRYQMGNRILSEDCHTIAVDQIRDTVMNLRVNMVRTTSQNDAPAACLLQVLKCLLTFFLNVLMIRQPFPPMPCEWLPSPQIPGYPGKSGVSLFVTISSEVRARNGFIKVMDGS